MVAFSMPFVLCTLSDESVGVSGSTCMFLRLDSEQRCILPHYLSPTGGIALVFLFFSLHLNPPKHKKTFRQHVSEFDFLGLFLIVAGVICLLLGFNQSENACECSVRRLSP